MGLFYKKHLTLFCKLTFVTKSRLVFLEALESDPLAKQVEELIEGGPPLLVVVHVLLSLLARPAVHHTHLEHVTLDFHLFFFEKFIHENK